MQSKRPNRRVAALALAGTLLLTTPALAAPAGGASWAHLPALEVLWTRVASAFGTWAGIALDGLAPTAGTPEGVPSSLDRITAPNGPKVDPDGSPEGTGSWTGDPSGDAPSGAAGSGSDG